MRYKQLSQNKWLVEVQQDGKTKELFFLYFRRRFGYPARQEKTIFVVLFGEGQILDLNPLRKRKIRLFPSGRGVADPRPK